MSGVKSEEEQSVCLKLGFALTFTICGIWTTPTDSGLQPFLLTFVFCYHSDGHLLASQHPFLSFWDNSLISCFGIYFSPLVRLLFKVSSLGLFVLRRLQKGSCWWWFPEEISIISFYLHFWGHLCSCLLPDGQMFPLQYSLQDIELIKIFLFQFSA